MPEYANYPERQAIGDFALAPEGEQQAVLCDVENLGEKPIAWKGTVKMKQRIALYFISEHKASGRPITVREEFTNSLWETARLRKFLGKWRGQPLTEDECRKFDLESLIGVNAMLTISHNKTPKRTYANIEAIRAYKGDIKLYVPVDYIRKRDRAKQQQSAGEPRFEHSDHDDYDADIPF